MKPWGKLVAITYKLDHIELCKDSYSFGSNQINNVVIHEKKINDIHCKIIKEKDDIKIIDLSQKGVFINDLKIGKEVSRKLRNEDIIYLLHRSTVSKQDVLGYVFYKVEDQRTSEKIADDDAKKLKNNLEGLKDDITCFICSNLIRNAVVLIPCLHSTCKNCLFSLEVKRESEYNCPECKNEVSKVKDYPLMDKLVNAYLNENKDYERNPLN